MCCQIQKMKRYAVGASEREKVALPDRTVSDWNGTPA